MISPRSSIAGGQTRRSTIYSPPPETSLSPRHLTPDQWSSVFGRLGSLNATTVKGFQDALGDLGHVGMTIGGGSFFGYGVNISGGTARFALVSYTIS